MRRSLHLAHATTLLLRRARAGSFCRSGGETMPMSTLAARRTAGSSSTSTSTARTTTPARRPSAPAPARALSAEASSSPSDSEEATGKKRSSSSIFGRGRPVALLERPVGSAASSSASSSSPSSSSPSPPPSADESLWRSGAFACEVFPDLPVAASWKGLLRAASGGLLDSEVDATTGDAPGVGRRRRRQGQEGEAEVPSSSSSAPALPPTFVVRTVAAQVRGLRSVTARIQRAAGVGPGGEPLEEETEGGKKVHSPDALLLLSGGHPARSLWAPTDSLRMLRAAADLRERGLIPKNIELWGVANPLLEKPERAAVAKRDAGADAVVTQPPLSERAWLCWWEGVQRLKNSGSNNSVPPLPVVGGLALPHSAGALRFWVALCGAAGVEGVEEEVAAFARGAAEAAAQAGSSSSPSTVAAAQRAHALSYCRRALSFYESLGDELAGIHVMPVTGPGRELAAKLLEEGALRRWDWRK